MSIRLADSMNPPTNSCVVFASDSLDFFFFFFTIRIFMREWMSFSLFPFLNIDSGSNNVSTG